MKSMIISAVFGTAILAIQGVSGAVMPVDITKRNEALEVRSEEAHSPTIKRAALPDVLSTNICIHSKWTKRPQCFPVTVKPENAAEPSTEALEKDTLEKRAEKLPLRDGYPDRATGKCDKLNNKYHWAQTSNHPRYCTQLLDKNPPADLWHWCYVLAPCDVPNGARSHPTDGEFGSVAPDGSDSKLKIREAATTNVQVGSTTAGATADRGCSAKGTNFYFAYPQYQAGCNSELVKGSEIYHDKIDPNAKWNDDIMRVCFEKANCDGGARWGPA
ncbi:MAG: hypothetical protein Q9221_005488 [Calogaya cf. arnoldii]